MDDSDAGRLAAAVNALYRVRAVEKPPDADGLREVWHHCAQDADLISLVDHQGRVVRQELTLLEDYLCWTSRDGVVTGSSGAARGSKGLTAGEAVMLDLELVPERVLRAHGALAGYRGDDLYLKNVRQVIALVLQGTQFYDEPTVTQGHGMPAFLSSAPREEPPVRRWWRVAIAALAVAAVAGLYLAFR
ncbi:MAG: hypothetical protein ACYC8T_10345 [Myxococcaceae bacterium]